MGTYVFCRDDRVVVYSNHNDKRLRTDGGAKDAFRRLGFGEEDGVDAAGTIAKAKVAFLHGGFTADQIISGSALTGDWEDKTIFVIFSSQGRRGDLPRKILGKNATEHLAVFIQDAPRGESFGTEVWERIIDWSLDCSTALNLGSVEQLISQYSSKKKWLRELTAQEYPEFLVSAYLIRVARESGLNIEDSVLPEHFWSKALGEYDALSNKSESGVDIAALDLAEIRSALNNVAT